jgi:hypothetical protein
MSVDCIYRLERPSGKQDDALLHEQYLHERVSAIEQSNDAVMHEERELRHVPLRDQLITYPSSQMVQTHIPSAGEEAIWQALETGDVNFDAGMEPDNGWEQQWLECKIDEFGIWNAERMGCVLGAEADKFVLDDSEDEMLAETLCNV